MSLTRSLTVTRPGLVNVKVGATALESPNAVAVQIPRVREAGRRPGRSSGAVESDSERDGPDVGVAVATATGGRFGEGAGTVAAKSRGAGALIVCVCAPPSDQEEKT